VRDIISPCGVIKDTFPFSVSLPLPHPFLLPVLSSLLNPLAILCSLAFSGPFWTTLCVLLTLADLVVIAIARPGHPAARRTSILPVAIIIILVDYLIPMQCSTGHKVA
jgi:hypothetical protein